MSTHATTMAVRTSNAKAIVLSLLTWVCAILLTGLAVTKSRPPEPEAATAPQSEFSAERALAHVRAIAAAPHPLGSAANDAVRSYLLAQLSSLGFNPDIFDGRGVSHFGSDVVIARTRDIVGRLPGTASSGAIMLVAHYDSVPLAPGAGDDAAAVASILESVRALRAGPALKNDLIVLFTDGEEFGLLGADAFASAHPWMKDVGLIMNFEGRGDRGPSLLFETSPGNSLLVEAVAHSTPHPIGSSLFYALYKLLPNDTDFTVFRSYKVPGLNFAFGENLEAYHTRLDSLANLSLASLQHHGSYGLSLARYFGQADLDQFKKPARDAVFFNWLGSSMIAYGESWVLPGELLGTLLLVVIIVLNVRRSSVQLTRLMLALAASLGILLAAPAVMVAAQWLLSRLLAGHMILGDSQANSYLLAGYVLLGACVAGLLSACFRKYFSLLELSLGGLLLTAILSWALALMLPAGSYVLFWPLLLATLGLLTITFLKKSGDGAQCLAGLAGAAMTMLLFAPLIYLLYVFLTLQLIAVAAIGILVGLFFILGFSFLNVAIPPNRWRIPVALLLVAAVGAFAMGNHLSRYDDQYPRRDTVLYSMNADNHSAEWISFDQSLDKWQLQLFANGSAQSGPMPDYLAGLERPVLSASASPLDLSPPVAEMKADEKQGDLRKITLNVRSQRNASGLQLRFLKDVSVVAVKIGTREISLARNSAPTTISLLAMDASGTDLELTVKAPDKISFWLMDQSYGLPAGVQPRPGDILASGPSDRTLICRKYSL